MGGSWVGRGSIGGRLWVGLGGHGWSWVDMGRHGWSWAVMGGHGWSWVGVGGRGWVVGGSWVGDGAP